MAPSYRERKNGELLCSDLCRRRLANERATYAGSFAIGTCRFTLLPAAICRATFRVALLFLARIEILLLANAVGATENPSTTARLDSNSGLVQRIFMLCLLLNSSRTGSLNSTAYQAIQQWNAIGLSSRRTATRRRTGRVRGVNTRIFGRKIPRCHIPLALL